MNGPSRSGPAAARSAAGALTAAVATAGTALGAHVAVAGCLPTAAGTALAVPATVAAALLLGRLLPDRPLLRLAGGQLAGHLALSAAAACAHAADGGVRSGAMVLAHVAALVLLRAVLDRCTAAGVAAAGAAARLLVRSASVGPAVSLPVLRRPPLPATAPLRALRRAVRVPVRGPPGRLLPAS